jgi:ATP-dependent exoDNAse (exonuclease V) beta subunit
MIYELRKRGIEASEEGGIALTDSAAVELMLSLFTLADHPGHSIASFHLKNSVLKPHLTSPGGREALSKKLRHDLFADGYGKFSAFWSKRIAPSCNHRDLSRLQQLVEKAYDFEPRSSLRADEFVAWIRQARVPDPSFASVRVMTIHGAKGLEFDTVVLPELDVALCGRPPTLVVGRDAETLEANFVCRYAAEELQQLLSAEQREAFGRERQSSVEESLSLLYVAMTRAIHALHLFVPGPRTRRSKGTWSALLERTLVPAGADIGSGPLHEKGDANWARIMEATPKPTQKVSPALTKGLIRFAPQAQEHPRGLERMAPSRREGSGRQSLRKLFDPCEESGMSAGTLYHLWFSQIEWLDGNLPSANDLRGQAEKERANLPDQIWKKLDEHIAIFHSFLENPEVAKIFDRSFFENRRLDRMERERRFFFIEGTQFWEGAMDRVLWFSQGGKTEAALVIDFKTDALEPGDTAAISDRVENYRPQMEIYRKAAAHLGGISSERVAVNLVFAKAGLVREV